MSKIDDIRTMIRNSYGISDEDVTNIIRMVSEIVAEQMPKPAPASAIPADVATKDYVQAYVSGTMSEARASLAASADEHATKATALTMQKNMAYRERNELVAVLSKIWPSSWSLDENEANGWKHVIYIDGPTGQLSWHVADGEFDTFFRHLDERPNSWDGHTSAQKCERLAQFRGDPWSI